MGQHFHVDGGDVDEAGVGGDVGGAGEQQHDAEPAFGGFFGGQFDDLDEAAVRAAGEIDDRGLTVHADDQGGGGARFREGKAIDGKFGFQQGAVPGNREREGEHPGFHYR